jgi:hypothetical protein
MSLTKFGYGKTSWHGNGFGLVILFGMLRMFAM